MKHSNPVGDVSDEALSKVQDWSAEGIWVIDRRPERILSGGGALAAKSEDDLDWDDGSTRREWPFRVDYVVPSFVSSRLLPLSAPSLRTRYGPRFDQPTALFGFRLARTQA